MPQAQAFKLMSGTATPTEPHPIFFRLPDVPSDPCSPSSAEPLPKAVAKAGRADGYPRVRPPPPQSPQPGRADEPPRVRPPLQSPQTAGGEQPRVRPVSRSRTGACRIQSSPPIPFPAKAPRLTASGKAPLANPGGIYPTSLSVAPRDAADTTCGGQKLGTPRTGSKAAKAGKGAVSVPPGSPICNHRRVASSDTVSRADAVSKIGEVMSRAAASISEVVSAASTAAPTKAVGTPACETPGTTWGGSGVVSAAATTPIRAVGSPAAGTPIVSNMQRLAEVVSAASTVLPAKAVGTPACETPGTAGGGSGVASAAATTPIRAASSPAAGTPVVSNMQRPAEAGDAVDEEVLPSSPDRAIARYQGVPACSSSSRVVVGRMLPIAEGLQQQLDKVLSDFHAHQKERANLASAVQRLEQRIVGAGCAGCNVGDAHDERTRSPTSSTVFSAQVEAQGLADLQARVRDLVACTVTCAKVDDLERMAETLEQHVSELVTRERVQVLEALNVLQERQRRQQQQQQHHQLDCLVAAVQDALGFAAASAGAEVAEAHQQWAAAAQEGLRTLRDEVLRASTSIALLTAKVEEARRVKESLQHNREAGQDLRAEIGTLAYAVVRISRRLDSVSGDVAGLRQQSAAKAMEALQRELDEAVHDVQRARSKSYASSIDEQRMNSYKGSERRGASASVCSPRPTPRTAWCREADLE